MIANFSATEVLIFWRFINRIIIIIIIIIISTEWIWKWANENTTIIFNNR